MAAPPSRGDVVCSSWCLLAQSKGFQTPFYTLWWTGRAPGWHHGRRWVAPDFDGSLPGPFLLHALHRVQPAPDKDWLCSSLGSGPVQTTQNTLKTGQLRLKSFSLHGELTTQEVRIRNSCSLHAVLPVSQHHRHLKSKRAVLTAGAEHSSSSFEENCRGLGASCPGRRRRRHRHHRRFGGPSPRRGPVAAPRRVAPVPTARRAGPSPCPTSALWADPQTRPRPPPPPPPPGDDLGGRGRPRLAAPARAAAGQGSEGRGWGVVLLPASGRGEREPGLMSGTAGGGARGLRVQGLGCRRQGD